MNEKIGSIWRKCDLHFHTPSSYDYKDASVTNQQIIEKLHATGISIIAITDHHLIDVERINDLKQIAKQYNICVLPGIEFLSEARGNEPIHFIGIFPEDSNLEFIWGQIKNRTNIKSIEGASKKHNEVYCDLFETVDLIKELHGIVSIHAGAKSNSIENITHSLPHGSAQKTDIASIIDIYELGKESDQEGYIKNVFPSIKKIIPMIICSDNHDIKNYNLKQNCWIKADPTFEGLKQIIYEPEQRVFIGEDPNKKFPKLKLEGIKIKNSKAFHLIDQEIKLNGNLVSIIGGRGSGKSALLETLTFCFGKNKKGDFNNEASDWDFNAPAYIQYFQGIGSDATFEIDYRDLDNNILDPFSKSLLDKSETYCEYPLMYLGQNQIENYANNSTKIHELAFEAVLKNSGLADDIISIQNEIKANDAELISVTKEIEASRLQLLSYNIDKVKNEKLKLEKELALLSSKETKEILESLNKSRAKKENYSKSKIALKDYIQILNDSFTRINEKENDINEMLPSLGLEDLSLKNNIQTSISEAKLVEEKLDKLNVISEYEEHLKDAEKKLEGKTDISASHFDSLKARIEDADKTIAFYNKEVQYLEQSIIDRYTLLHDFDELLFSLRGTYGDAIFKFKESNSIILKSMNLESHVSMNLKRIAIDLFEKVDKRKIKDFEKFKNEILKLNNYKGFKYGKWVKEFEANKDNFNYFFGNGRQIFEEIAFKNPYRLNTKISYEISLDNYKPINTLSLGQKGTVLLKLFLSIGNNCPIIIDQPEDHLDNHFIYTDLVATIKNAKERRQIILVTHDANIVVNGDSEQIIVAEFSENIINYNLSGAIENPTIKEAVTKILEGGKEAFSKRNKKYRIS
jgi:energy-coupling factor transporter ATP-binding protein EcfA2